MPPNSGTMIDLMRVGDLAGADAFAVVFDQDVGSFARRTPRESRPHRQRASAGSVQEDKQSHVTGSAAGRGPRAGLLRGRRRGAAWPW
jgi:hypothetical protein